MRLEDYLDVEGPDMIRLKGHRIGLHDIVKLYHQGYQAEQIPLVYPSLTLEQIHAALDYYLRHQTEIDAQIARIEAESEAAYQSWLSDPDGGQSPLIRRLSAARSTLAHDQEPTGS